MSARTSSAIQRQVKFAPAGRIFSHSEASRLFRDVRALRGAQQIVIDLGRAEDATTSAFAQMVLLRRWLLRSGRDLRLINLHSRAAGLFEVNRLQGVLPLA
jgi:hypothetical protein